MAGLGGSLGYMLGGIDWQGSGGGGSDGGGGGGGDDSRGGGGGGSGGVVHQNWRAGAHRSDLRDLEVQATSDRSEVVFAAVFFIYLVCAAITVSSIKEVIIILL